MQTRSLGHTGVDVSALCLGAMYFGSRNDRATSYRLLDSYVGAGGSFIDTANIYARRVDDRPWQSFLAVYRLEGRF
jgi:aryl-alcohol dehydrogenase-like predicted oxidoreductase